MCGGRSSVGDAQTQPWAAESPFGATGRREPGGPSTVAREASSGSAVPGLDSFARREATRPPSSRAPGVKKLRKGAHQSKLFIDKH